MKKLIGPIICAVIAASSTSLLGQTPEFSKRISSVNVSSFAEDNDGVIWIGTSHGLNKYNGADYLVYYSRISEGDLNSDQILDLAVGKDNIIWIADYNGLTYFKEGRFFNSTRSAFNPIERVLELDKDHIICSGRNGIVKFVKETWEFKALYTEPGLGWTRHLAVTSLKEIWSVSRFQGKNKITILDSDLQHLQDFPLDDTEDIIGLTCTGNNMWIATDSGLLKFDTASKLPCGDYNNLKAQTDGKRIVFIEPYDRDHILVGTAGEGMFIYDMNEDHILHIEQDNRLEEDSYVCMVDSQKNIWLSDRKNDIQFIPHIREYRHIATGNGNDFRQISYDRNGYLWVGSDSLIYSYDTSSQTVLWSCERSSSYDNFIIDSKNRLCYISDRNTLKCCPLSKGRPASVETYTFDSEISSLCEDKDGNIWVFGNFEIFRIENDGIKELSQVNPVFSYGRCDPLSGTVYVNDVVGHVHEYDAEKNDFVEKDLSGIENIISFFTAKDGSIWVSTFRNGIFNIIPQTGETLHYDVTNGLMENSVKAIIEDNDGNIWVSTNRHISKFDPVSRRFVNFHDVSYSTNDVYQYGSACISPYGDILFGGSNGITEIKSDAQMSDPVDNILIIPEYADIDGKTITDIKDGITLSPNEKSFTIHFSGISYGSGASLNYATKLDGYDKGWKYSNEKDAYFSNLKPGPYTFRAKVRLMNGEWSNTEIEVPVRIKHSIWNSYPFILSLMILLAGFFVFMVKTYLKWRLQSERLEISERAREIASNHLNFLSNVSHEIRTPLSLIYGPLSHLKKDPGLSDGSRNMIEIISHNADRLKELSKKMMTRPEENDRKLRVIKEDISGILNDVASLFMVSAQEKNIRFNTDIPDIDGYIDREKVEIITFNLLSNAIKYTPQNGHVLLSLSRSGDNCTITVKDDGIGISKEKSKGIFSRYERLDVEKEMPDIPGNGIGLNYAQSLAEAHKGKIRYSPNDGPGSTFTFEFPVTKASYQDEDIGMDFLKRESSPAHEGIPFSDGKSTVILAEDDRELLSFLKDTLSQRYNILGSTDGEACLELMTAHVPDLVVSDVMMPKMDGYTLCEKIRSNPEISHVPIILLTAKDDLQSSIKGVKAGADAYVSKPFDPEYLQALIETLLDNRRKSQSRILNMTPSTMEKESDEERKSLNKMDEEFLKKLHKVMDRHIGDESFSMEVLASETMVSYSSLYNKVKAMTGCSPLTFFNTYKMNIAKEMLQSGNYTISEVADKMGASSPSNFSRDFKKHFGKMPKDFTPS